MKNVQTEKKNYQQHYQKFIDFSVQKLKMTFFTKLLFSIMGGAFVAIGFIAYILSRKINDSWGIVVGSLLFPVGLLMCLFLGGNLFTSNCIASAGVLSKRYKWYHLLADLSVTLLGNFIGSFIVALIAWGAGAFHGDGYDALMRVANTKLNLLYTAQGHVTTQGTGHEWWTNIFSGMLCNVLVAGSVIAFITIDKKGVSVFVVYLMLVVFVLCGFQHVVANLFLYSAAMLAQIDHPTWDAVHYGQVFYVNLLPTLIGNFLGGVLITMACIGTNVLKHKHDDEEKQ